ncbi:CD209 antigen-like protein E isoform X1 [Xyrichtys novacula]|uniref:CD209 antigen-like protein E isoform X1 n=1 Tax=Xyrichtys novacula TaxID=13765 RepID=A0AAV1EYK1_XYRNO|nr:CD209 antigen-like protein E isoform X1 [Xyrichtys novacula]
MEPEDQIYVNLEELQGDTDGLKCHRPEGTGRPPLSPEHCTPADTKPVTTDDTWTLFKSSTVCLGLLSFLLLTAVITVGVLYNRDFSQLSTDLANRTAEKYQLLAQNQNLTEERDQLQIKFSNLTKAVGMCPDGWKRLGLSCYLFSTVRQSWSSSRWKCQSYGADLVIVRSQTEMKMTFEDLSTVVTVIRERVKKVFLNKFGHHLKFWIGLSKSHLTSWRWTDGSSLKTGFWQDYRPTHYIRTEQCAAFNSFQFSIYLSSIKSWTDEHCNTALPGVCEKKVEIPL